MNEQQEANSHFAFKLFSLSLEKITKEHSILLYLQNPGRFRKPVAANLLGYYPKVTGPSKLVGFECKTFVNSMFEFTLNLTSAIKHADATIFGV